MTITRQPTGYGSTVRAMSHLVQHKDGSATLEIQEIFPIIGTRPGVSFMLPATPTKWAGTRAQTLASTYTSFRPLSFELIYVPIVSAGTGGYVSIGTVFDGTRLPDGATDDTLARALAATNGGFVTAGWTPASSKVALGRNLRANTFPLYDVQDDDIPFWIVSNSNVTKPGYIVIRSRMTLHNPASATLNPFALLLDVFGSEELTDGINVNANASAANTILQVGQAIAFKLGQALNSVTPAMKTIYGVVKEVTASTVKIFVAGSIGAVSLNTLGFIFLRAAFPAEPIAR